MTNILSLNNAAIPAEMKNDPNASLVARLEEMLELAKSGELQVLAYSGLLSDGGWRYGHVCDTKSDALKLYALIDLSKNQTLKDIAGDDNEHS